MAGHIREHIPRNKRAINIVLCFFFFFFGSLSFQTYTDTIHERLHTLLTN